MIAKPPTCIGCPLFSAPFVPPYCNCPACRKDRARNIYNPERCTAPLLTIGMAPSAEEVRQQIPLVGPSGRIHSSTLQQQGYRGPERKLNLVQCRTTRPGREGPVNRDPLIKEVRFCRTHFLDLELAAFTARGGLLILLLGALAYDHITSKRYGAFNVALGHRLKP